MSETALLALAALASLSGMAWLALAMPVHWQQVRGGDAGPSTRTAVALRSIAAVSIAGSLGLCLAADHASIAVLVWIMLQVVSALLLSFALAVRPHWLSWLTLSRHGG